MTEQFVVGIIRGSHGVTGEFKVESTSGEYGHFAGMKEVTLTNGTEKRVCKVEYADEVSDGLLMKLAGINTPEQAKLLNRWEIVVPRSQAHPLKKNEFYIEDLKGCSMVFVPADEKKAGKDGLAAEAAPASKESLAEAVDSMVVGLITDVTEGGAGDLFEVSLSEGCEFFAPGFAKTAKGVIRTVLIPFNRDFIGAIDVEGRKVQLMHLWILE